MVQYDPANLGLLFCVKFLNKLAYELGAAVAVVFVQVRVALIRERALAEKSAALAIFAVRELRNDCFRRVEVKYDQESVLGKLKAIPDRRYRVLYRKR